MYKKAIGSILLILGTSIGAGMLALPVVTSHENYFMTVMLLITSWTIMTLGAFSLLEVNLWFAPGANLISMARSTLGNTGKSITWVIYLLLLYCLICAYLSGMSDITQTLFSTVHLSISRALATLLSLSLFGIIVYRGIGSVDVVNRSLMTTKIIAYLILVFVIATQVNVDYVFQGGYELHTGTFLVMLTSFGYAIIVPSLRSYLNSNTRLLKNVVFIGSLLPLLIYGIWILVVQGLIPKEGQQGLISMLSSSQTNSLLMQSMGSLLHAPWLAHIVKLFISICAITSFLGVSVCLVDFIIDGLQLTQKRHSKMLAYLTSYLPPLLIVLMAPGIFIHALSYAGALCLLLLIILPLAMLYSGRYRYNITGEVILPCGKLMIVGLLILSLAILVMTL